MPCTQLWFRTYLVCSQPPKRRVAQKIVFLHLFIPTSLNVDPIREDCEKGVGYEAVLHLGEKKWSLQSRTRLFKILNTPLDNDSKLFLVIHFEHFSCNKCIIWIDWTSKVHRKFLTFNKDIFKSTIRI